MLAKFWDKLAEGLAETWNARLISLAVGFWGGGLLLIAEGQDWGHLKELLQVNTDAKGIVRIVAYLFIVLLSSWLVKRLTLTTLRLSEGYWPWVFKKLRRNLAEKAAIRIRKQREELRKLAEKYQKNELDMQGTIEYVALDEKLMTYPVKSRHMMPTRLGNILRAAEEYPYLRYGLETNVTWPRLWLLLPIEVRQEIAAARARLDEETRLLLWGIFFILWTFFAGKLFYVSLLVSVAVIWIARQGMLSAAGVYGELLRSTYDLHRFALYRSLGFHPPADSESEIIRGEQLTEFLHRGTGSKTWFHVDE